MWIPHIRLFFFFLYIEMTLLKLEHWPDLNGDLHSSFAISCDLHFNRSTIFGMIFQFAIGSHVTERQTFSAKSKLWNVIFHWFNISKRKFSKANSYLTCTNVFAPQHTNTHTQTSLSSCGNWQNSELTNMNITRIRNELWKLNPKSLQRCEYAYDFRTLVFRT